MYTVWPIYLQLIWDKKFISKTLTCQLGKHFCNSEINLWDIMYFLVLKVKYSTNRIQYIHTILLYIYTVTAWFGLRVCIHKMCLLYGSLLMSLSHRSVKFQTCFRYFLRLSLVKITWTWPVRQASFWTLTVDINLSGIQYINIQYGTIVICCNSTKKQIPYCMCAVGTVKHINYMYTFPPWGSPKGQGK